MAALEPGKARMTYPDPEVEDAIVDAMQVPHFEHGGWQYAEGDREDWPAELRETGRAGMVYIRNRTTGGTAFVPELSGHLAERGWELVDPDAERAADLEAKKVAELRELAKERGISPIPTTKAELLEALQEETAEGAGEPPAEREGEEE